MFILQSLFFRQSFIGHLSLARAARSENDVVIASIFVNPTQFGEGEDLETYPKQLERDVDLLTEIGVVSQLCNTLLTASNEVSETNNSLSSFELPLQIKGPRVCANI